jgi:hypothetical protein
MEILDAYKGGAPPEPARHRWPLVDPFRAKVDELVQRSRGQIRADQAQLKRVAMGYVGRSAPRGGRSPTPSAGGGRSTVGGWMAEPGMWVQWDYGDGPVVQDSRTVLFCAWLAWSRYRVVVLVARQDAAEPAAEAEIPANRLPDFPKSDYSRAPRRQNEAAIRRGWRRSFGQCQRGAAEREPHTWPPVGSDSESGRPRLPLRRGVHRVAFWVAETDQDGDALGAFSASRSAKFGTTPNCHKAA